MEIEIFSDKELVVRALRSWANGSTFESATTGFMMLNREDMENCNTNGHRALKLAEEIEQGAIPDFHNQ